jgi:hypothetical protein
MEYGLYAMKEPGQKGGHSLADDQQLLGRPEW